MAEGSIPPIDENTAAESQSPELPRPLAVVKMHPEDRVGFLRALAGPDGSLPVDIAVVTRSQMLSGPSGADADVLAEAAVDVHQRELDAAQAAEEGAAAAARAARTQAETAHLSHRSAIQQLAAADIALDALRGEYAEVEEQRKHLAPAVSAAAHRADLFESLAADAGRSREDLRHRAAVAILTSEAELEASRAASAQIDPAADLMVIAAHARLEEATSELASFASRFGPTSLDAAARKAIESAHDNVLRLRGKRRAEAALSGAEAAEATLLAQHGFASYLDFTIGNATLEFGSLAADGIEHARDAKDSAARAVAAAIEAVQNRTHDLERRSAELDQLAEQLRSARTNNDVAAVVERLPAVTGDPAAWQDYAKRSAQLTRSAGGALAKTTQLTDQLADISSAQLDLERFAISAKAAAASAAAEVAKLWEMVDAEESVLASMVALRTAAEGSLLRAQEAQQRRSSGEVSVADDLCDAVLAYAGPVPTGSIVLDDALADVPAEIAIAVLNRLQAHRPEGDLLCLTESAELLEWAASGGQLGVIERWWSLETDTATAIP